MKSKPEELRELIPLYLNGRLTERERQEFEDLLAKYPEVNRELMEFSEIRDACQEAGQTTPAPSKTLFHRILKNIESDTKRSTLPVRNGSRGDLWVWLRGVLVSPRTSWGIAAVQLAIILLLITSPLVGNKIRTLTSDLTLRNEGKRISVVFHEDSREKDIRAVLNRVGATIVMGPSTEGLYTIRVGEDLNIEQVIGTLERSEFVEFVEKAY